MLSFGAIIILVAEQIEMLVMVKAYPAISGRYGEAVCVAGIRTDVAPRWVRLYPIRFRDLPFDRKFKKYQVVRLEASAHGTDTRPESLRPVEDSLQPGDIIDTKKKWAKRRTYVDPLVVDSMCWLQRQQKIDGTSLGVFRPADVAELTIEALPTGWDLEKQSIIDQPSLFGPGKTGLEKIPYRFRFRYRCNDPKCGGHHQSIIDWELGQAYLKFRDLYRSEEETMAKIRQKWLNEMCGPTKDTRFFVGNQHQHPEAFLVLGVFWPPKA